MTLFIIIQFGYYPWVPEFWVANPHGYTQGYNQNKILNFMGTQPENTHGIQTQTQPKPKF